MEIFYDAIKDDPDGAGPYRSRQNRPHPGLFFYAAFELDLSDVNEGQFSVYKMAHDHKGIVCHAPFIIAVSFSSRGPA